jgi:tripartite motif-containing protein 71
MLRPVVPACAATRALVLALLLLGALAAHRPAIARAAACPGADPCPYSADQLLAAPHDDTVREPVSAAIDPVTKDTVVADLDDRRIVAFHANGTSAGAPVSSFGADDRFNAPNVVATDVHGNRYVLDNLDGRVVVLHPDGTQLTTFGSPGSALDQLGQDEGLAVDSDTATPHVYIADRQAGDSRVVRWTVDLAGAAAHADYAFAAASGVPYRGIAVAGARVYVGDFSMLHVYDAGASSATHVTDFDGTDGTNPQAGGFEGVAVDGAGARLFVSDSTSVLEYAITSSGGVPSFHYVTGGFGTSSFPLNHPDQLAVDPGSHALVVASAYDSAVARFTYSTADATITPVTTTLGHPGAGQLVFPGEIDRDAAGHLWVADTRAHRLQELDGADGHPLHTFDLESGGYPFDPTNIALNATGTRVYADDTGSAGNTTGVHVFDVTGADGTRSGTAVSLDTPAGGSSPLPVGLAVDAAGDLFVADSINNRIVVADSTGSQMFSWSTGADTDPVGVALDGAGHAYVSREQAAFKTPAEAPVVRYALDVAGHAATLDGTYVTDPSGQLDNPGPIAYDATNDRVFVTNTFNSDVYVLDHTGALTASFGETGSGPGQFRTVGGLAVGADGATLYAGDTGNSRVHRFTLGGSAPVLAPTVGATTAGAVTTGGATLSASVTPGGEPAAHHFEYGTVDSGAYASSTPAATTAGAADPETAHATLSGLQPGTAYHARLVASNSAGTTTGAPASFTTTAPAPADTGTPPATGGSAPPADAGGPPSAAPPGLTLNDTLAARALGLSDPRAFEPPVTRVLLDYRPYAKGQTTGTIVVPAGAADPKPHPACVRECHFWKVDDVIADVQQRHAAGIFITATAEAGRKTDIDDPYAATATATTRPALGVLAPAYVYYASPLTGTPQLPKFQTASATAPAQLFVRYWSETRDPVRHVDAAVCPYDQLPARLVNLPLADAAKAAEQLSKSNGCDLRFVYTKATGYGDPRVRKVTSRRDGKGEYADVEVLQLTPPPPASPAPGLPPEVQLAKPGSDLVAHVIANGFRPSYPSFDQSWALPLPGVFQVAVSDRAEHVDGAGRPFNAFLGNADVLVQYRPDGARDFREVGHYPTRMSGDGAGRTQQISLLNRPGEPVTGPGTIQLVITAAPRSGPTLVVTSSFKVAGHQPCVQEFGGAVFADPDGTHGHTYRYAPAATTCAAGKAATAAFAPWDAVVAAFRSLFGGFSTSAQAALNAGLPAVQATQRLMGSWVPSQASFGGPLNGANVIAAGSGNVIAAGSGNVIAAGSGNVIAAGSGNVIARATSLITPSTGTSMLTSTATIHGAPVIAAGSGNVIAAGSGNVIAAGSGNVIAAGSGNVIDLKSAGIIAAGSGNVVAAGSGNIIAAGSGNIIAAGSGNIIAAGSGN